MAKTRVLQLIDGLNIGGAEMILLELVKGLRKRGFDVAVGYSTPGPLAERLVSSGVETVRLPRLARVDPLLFMNTYRLIKDFHPQIVHTHLFKSDFHGRLAARLARVPVVLSTLHSTDRWAQKFPLGLLYGWTANFADRLIAVSDDLRVFHQQHTKVSAQKFITIENGVDLEVHRYSASAREKMRQNFSFTESEFLFGIIGRLTPPKNHANFLASAALIHAELPDARFVIVGDGALREMLEARVVELGLAEVVLFTGFRDDISEIMSMLDVLVFSSDWEGLPVTLLEGMAAERPIVATEVGGIPAVVGESDAALLVPAADPAALARACVQLATDPELCRGIGQAALNRVQSAYSIDAMLDRTVALYESLLANAGVKDAHSE
jgi:glycosyltransferase involved in cell wall biosynthesis